ncbi:MAG: family hydrolase, diadenosine tetraphosphate hydrolase [Actinomycetia bacterium]|nr:family hydrolase, diadenosine tetraphosphate hydrolase [Actinomycetes bacterium]
MLDHLWAGWRGEYVATADELNQGDACVFCRILGSDLPDEQTYVLWRGEKVFAILNKYPYTGGHLMVMPTRHVGELDQLDDDEYDELFRAARTATAALKAAYSPQGFNLGANLGKAGGAGVPGHLHVHVLPRWSGDTNFMTTIGETRVLPEMLDDAWKKLKEAWPA